MSASAATANAIDVSRRLVRHQPTAAPDSSASATAGITSAQSRVRRPEPSHRGLERRRWYQREKHDGTELDTGGDRLAPAMPSELIERPRQREAGADREGHAAEQARPDGNDDQRVGEAEGRQSDERDAEAAGSDANDAADARMARRERDRPHDGHTTTHVNLLRETNTIGSQVVVGHWSLVVGRWSLVVGLWSLVVGRSAPPSRQRRFGVPRQSSLASQASGGGTALAEVKLR